MKFKALVLFSLATLSASAQSPSSEIDKLFHALETSGCNFSRNGSWYSAEEASTHLHRKYEYLAKKGQAKSAESFIDLAASKSSMSGKPYMVRCGNSTPVESRSWFLRKLADIRAAAGRR